MSDIVYDVGDTGRLAASFVDDVGADVDQTSIAATVVKPDGTSASYSVEIVHDSTGHYHLDVDVDQSGLWEAKFVGDVDVVPVEFFVRPDASAGGKVGLTTLRALRLWVLRDGNDESADEKLTTYGEVFSERVADYCKRQFLPDPADPGDPAVDHVFGYAGEGLLSLAPYELRPSVDTAIVLYTDRVAGEQQTLDTTQYRLLPHGGTIAGTYEAVSLILPRLPEQQYGFGWEVAVTGRWGMAAVPRSVELAVWICVDDAMKNPASMALQQLGGYTVQPEQLGPDFDLDDRGGLPRAAIWALSKYRRRKTKGTFHARVPGATARTQFGRDLPRI